MAVNEERRRMLAWCPFKPQFVFFIKLSHQGYGLPLAFLRYPVPVDENIKIRLARHKLTTSGGAYKLNTMDAW